VLGLSHFNVELADMLLISPAPQKDKLLHV
jgi:hypothetical protein